LREIIRRSQIPLKKFADKFADKFAVMRFQWISRVGFWSDAGLRRTLPLPEKRMKLGEEWWRRRELNPRPKMLLAKRLHA